MEINTGRAQQAGPQTRSGAKRVPTSTSLLWRKTCQTHTDEFFQHVFNSRQVISSSHGCRLLSNQAARRGPGTRGVGRAPRSSSRLGGLAGQRSPRARGAAAAASSHQWHHPDGRTLKPGPTDVCTGPCFLLSPSCSAVQWGQAR